MAALYVERKIAIEYVQLRPNALTITLAKEKKCELYLG